ncbi:hypothetical protein A3A71_00465 [Candidatus Berkelbacteria bacterium RIFCSPLOWO2_01_FULL_50_28]|uniref:Peptidase C39-like domain-containing protein n=1 Tax=Candidatus Berkelbacteria bacterium RIFCSPLOWO2_01_FULL_50_28 TaxID=1797471 RepID=A0A1F5EAT8_9BACT|nr:MAG: hypothetical protein A2807_01215 [Candidatus Berkelbacteria bacterium RIFCSPHIGHO2_01_FULL_50_36]OGD62342.1 MAG: hypothetical protein A3F39_02685 [Candidatus Berkelbacteria bacterium RIFCSPHIGHO2_12_FULL_50_11]OGD64518.1 MAG: hypothetical protein A3A71_00465 [Candidatus Berkelbacteria bacterium RIFCSPLOWO2_01_FULL_50_28]
MRRGGALWLIVIVIFIVLTLVAVVLPFAAFVGIGASGPIAQATGAGGSGLGCFVADQEFSNISVANNPDEIVVKLGAKYPAAKLNAAYIKQVLERGKKEGLNPLIPLAIWNGEQNFKNPEKAFGYGYRDSGTDKGVSNWDAQLNGVYRSTRLATQSQDPYDSPSGTNSFTRLFYHYTTAMKVIYENSGNSWDEEATYKDGSKPLKNRLAVIRLLAPSQVTCQSVLVSGVSSGQGNDGVPLFKQGDYKNIDYAPGNSIAASGCCTTAAAMILRFYGKLDADPISISKFSYQNGAYVAGKGTDHAKLVPLLAKKYSLNYEVLGNDWSRALTHLTNNHPLLAAGKGALPYTSGGHCIVITGYNAKTGELRINNPAKGDGPYPLSQIKSETHALYFLGR